MKREPNASLDAPPCFSPCPFFSLFYVDVQAMFSPEGCRCWEVETVLLRVRPGVKRRRGRRKALRKVLPSEVEKKTEVNCLSLTLLLHRRSELTAIEFFKKLLNIPLLAHQQGGLRVSLRSPHSVVAVSGRAAAAPAAATNMMNGKGSRGGAASAATPTATNASGIDGGRQPRRPRRAGTGRERLVHLLLHVRVPLSPGKF